MVSRCLLGQYRPLDTLQRRLHHPSQRQRRLTRQLDFGVPYSRFNTAEQPSRLNLSCGWTARGLHNQ